MATHVAQGGAADIGRNAKSAAARGPETHPRLFHQSKEGKHSHPWWCHSGAGGAKVRGGTCTCNLRGGKAGASGCRVGSWRRRAVGGQHRNGITSRTAHCDSRQPLAEKESRGAGGCCCAARGATPAPPLGRGAGTPGQAICQEQGRRSWEEGGENKHGPGPADGVCQAPVGPAGACAARYYAALFLFDVRATGFMSIVKLPHFSAREDERHYKYIVSAAFMRSRRYV